VHLIQAERLAHKGRDSSPRSTAGPRDRRAEVGGRRTQPRARCGASAHSELQIKINWLKAGIAGHVMPVLPRHRGRPPGSKNRPKRESANGASLRAAIERINAEAEFGRMPSAVIENIRAARQQKSATKINEPKQSFRGIADEFGVPKPVVRALLPRNAGSSHWGSGGVGQSERSQRAGTGAARHAS
jgi:hypothetical protein